MYLEIIFCVYMLLKCSAFFWNGRCWKIDVTIQCVPFATKPGWLVDRCSVSQQLGALQAHTTDTFQFVSHTTNVLLFKFRCNIFIGVRIIKEMPGAMVSGTQCIIKMVIQ